MPPKANLSAGLKGQNVSRETRLHLERYHALLIKWQSAVNLVSNKTLDDAWSRHFEDSAQILPLIPDSIKVIVDIGSGAGFPGAVLGILRPDLKVHLIESDQKKCTFLQNVSRETESELHIHGLRIETAHNVVKPDMVTARALASLDQLCAYCLPWAENNSDLIMLFLKGEKYAEEITEAQKNYTFDIEDFPSQTDPAARILRLKNLQKG